MIKGKFCSDCEFFDPIDNFLGKCKIKYKRLVWIERPACDRFQEKIKEEEEKASE